MSNPTATGTQRPSKIVGRSKSDGAQRERHRQAQQRFLEPSVGGATIPLVRELCAALDTEGIQYCHWKDNDALGRVAFGEKDLDLLVRRADIRCFKEILYRLSFKEVQDAPHQRIPGIQSFYGYDVTAERLVHVHVHYQLTLGHDRTKNYRLPIERPYLESADFDDVSLFKIPAPEFEFVIFVLRMILKHSTWDTILAREGTLSERERHQFADLESRTSPTQVRKLLEEHLPYLDATLFEECQRSLQGDCRVWTRALIGSKLQAALRPHARRSVLVELWLKHWRRVARAVRRRVTGRVPRCRLASGGAMIAFVGGDGAGKTTIVDQLHAWLSKDFDVRAIHLGKPGRSLATTAFLGVLKIGQLLRIYPPGTSFQWMLNQKPSGWPGYLWLLREVFLARDRYRTYLRARRFAARGGLVICDRFPLPQIRLMDGPQTERLIDLQQASRLARFLARSAESYYDSIVPPELLFVLRVDPEIAVQRKLGDDARYVRERNTEIWNADWKGSQAVVIDASRPRADVLSESKSITWSRL